MCHVPPGLEVWAPLDHKFLLVGANALAGNLKGCPHRVKLLLQESFVQADYRFLIGPLPFMRNPATVYAWITLTPATVYA